MADVMTTATTTNGIIEQITAVSPRQYMHIMDDGDDEDSQLNDERYFVE
jgi:hypothetical protein